LLQWLRSDAESLAKANPDGWVYVHVEDIGYKE